MGLEAVGHFRPYTAKRKTAMSTKTCPAQKKKKWKVGGRRRKAKELFSLLP
jgi:hypothetical protein